MFSDVFKTSSGCFPDVFGCSCFNLSQTELSQRFSEVGRQSPGGQASRRDDCQPSQMSVGCSQMFSGCSRDVLMISQGYSGRSGWSGGPDWSGGSCGSFSFSIRPGEWCV